MQQSGMPRTRLWIMALGATIFCSACATTSTTNTINRASEFAQAGISFADSLDPVLNLSFEAKVRANSTTLELGRSRIIEDGVRVCRDGEDDVNDEGMLVCCAADRNQDECREDALDEALQEQTEKERQRVELYQKFRAHTQVLRNYFQTLSSLATSDQPQALGQSAQQLVNQAQTLRENITDKQPSIDVGNVPQILVTQVANSFRSRSLQKVLRETAPAISTELALQEAFLNNLAEQTSADLGLAFQIQDDEKINDPFVVSTKPLPADWADRRLAAARRGLDLNAVDAARKAAGTLRVAFEALVENRLDAASLGGLIQDLNNLATLALEVGRVRKNKEDGGES